MISHITLGTNDLSKAIAFYDQILGLIGAKQIAKTEDVVFYAFPGSDTKLSITKPHNKETATYGNGTMLALKVNSNELVKKVYQLAMRLGSTCEGKPGPRNDNAYFACYIRDLDNNKIAIFHRGNSAGA